jgi:hypothetical protein
MQPESRSEHCSLMAHPGGPPKPKVRPADCPKDAAYIKTTDAGGKFTLPGDAPFPVVFEGGDGNDSVTVEGSGHGIIVNGGKGDDSLLVRDQGMLPSIEGVPAYALLLFGALLVTLAAVAVIGWRALGNTRGRIR